MRTKPIGTGPFKFVEFKANESIKLTKNPGLLEEGPAASRRHRIHHHYQPFDGDSWICLRQVRHDVPDRSVDPAAQGRQIAGAERGLRGRADQRLDQHHRQFVLAAVRQSRYPPRAGAGAGSQGVRPDPVRGQADIGGTMLPRAGRLVGDAEGNAGNDPRLRPRHQRQPRRGAQADAEGRLRPGQASRRQGLHPQHCRSIAIPPSS